MLYFSFKGEVYRKTNPMKKKFLIPFLTALILTATSCTDTKQNVNQAQTDFILVDKTIGFVKDAMGTPYVEFKYEGDLTNHTQNIYKSARVRMALEFTLENGSVLTDVDIAEAKNVFGASYASDMIEMYKPNDVYSIKNMRSNVISRDYTSYPIKSVTLRFKIQLVDEINNSEQEIYIKNEDITAEWQKVVNGNVNVDE